MKEKIKTQKSFIQIIIPIVIILFGSGIAFGVIYFNNSSLIKEAKRLTEGEQYEEAINKLQLAQASFIVEKLTLNKQKIASEINENEQKLKDKSRYEQGLNEFDKNNWQGSINILSGLPESSFYYQKAQTKIEEAKRKMVEGELSKETTAKLAAEAKANQEELEKNIKEQQLSQKEAEEQRMKADNDKDGLTYVQELAAGTSDLNPDSDGDGVIDSLDEHPAGGSRNIAQDFQWTYQNSKWEYTLSIPDDWYQYYKNKPRVPHGTVYVTFDDPYIKQIAQKIKTTAEINGYHTTSFLLAFIQSLPYVADSYTKFDELPKYPIETIIERNGDCEDTAYLCASLIQAMNIGSALIQFSDHMGVGVKTVHSQSGYYYPVGDDWYYYYETTGEGGKIGELPDVYKYQSAKVMVVGQIGSQIVYPQYVKPCYASPDFSGYYSDGSNYYSDSQCNYQTDCLPFSSYTPDTSLSGYYYQVQLKQIYHDSSCTQIVVKGCYKSKSYPGYFYRSGSSWYYDSQCVQSYMSMSCSYPSSSMYSCVYEFQYTSKKSTCDSLASRGMTFSSQAESCNSELIQCRNDIGEYQNKLSEYNTCFANKEY